MNAIKFIQQHGIDKAREVVDGQKDTVAPNLFKYFSPSLNDYHMINIESNVRISELKRLVESVDLIIKLGGIEVAKEKLTYGNSISAMRLSYETTITGRDGTKQNVITGVYLEDLEQAIADYEAIYSGEQHV